MGPSDGRLLGGTAPCRVDRRVPHQHLQLLQARAAALHVERGEGVPQDVRMAEPIPTPASRLLVPSSTHHR